MLVHEIFELGGKISHDSGGSEVKGPLKVLLLIKHPDVDLNSERSQRRRQRLQCFQPWRNQQQRRLPTTIVSNWVQLVSNQSRTWMPRSVRCLNRDFLISKLQQGKKNPPIMEGRSSIRQVVESLKVFLHGEDETHTSASQTTSRWLWFSLLGSPSLQEQNKPPSRLWKRLCH